MTLDILPLVVDWPPQRRIGAGGAAVRPSPAVFALGEADALEAVDRPVGAEHAALRAEDINTGQHPSPDTVDRPVVVRHAAPGDLAGDIFRLRCGTHAVSPVLEVFVVACRGFTAVIEDERDVRKFLCQIARLRHGFPVDRQAGNQIEVCQHRVTAMKIVIDEVITFREVADAAGIGVAAMPLEFLAGIRMLEVRISDYGQRKTGAINGGLDPGSFFDRVFRADGGLEMHCAGYVGLPGFGDVVVDQIGGALEFLQSIAELRILTIGHQPAIVETRLLHIPEVKVAIDEIALHYDDSLFLRRSVWITFRCKRTSSYACLCWTASCLRLLRARGIRPGSCRYRVEAAVAQVNACTRHR